jgi:hypothetical protein
VLASLDSCPASVILAFTKVCQSWPLSNAGRHGAEKLERGNTGQADRNKRTYHLHFEIISCCALLGFQSRLSNLRPKLPDLEPKKLWNASHSLQEQMRTGKGYISAAPPRPFKNIQRDLKDL